MQRFPITKAGFAKMESELFSLKNFDRVVIINAIAEARSQGDLSENAEYHSARERQSFLETKIQELEDKIARAEVIDISKMNFDNIKFGATVTVYFDESEEEVTYTIVGEYEADINFKRLSILSPLAKSLIGKREGDVVEFITPKGRKSLEVLSIKYEEIVM